MGLAGFGPDTPEGGQGLLRLMDKILHDPKDPKVWELWYIPCNGSCRILSINRMKDSVEKVIKLRV